ncbi:MAG: glutamate-1-semialdehyde 2,1-aminomutase [Candidatus Verstraetearchaeota archaeon]|nr:glutamate-1-semialdehyde 2,1-aminomutase [Candidatus Verstraetearchaeota archaeon]
MKSSMLFNRAISVLPGGVSSPVRRFSPAPFFTFSAKGSRIFTEDGASLIDYCLAYGPLIFGHAPDFLVDAVIEQIRNGTVYGTPHEAEVKLAEEVIRSVPSVSMIRFVNSGGEAAMSAVRLARAFTKRKKIIKFDGCYHGAVDSLLVDGIGANKSPLSEGITKGVLEDTLVLPYNNASSLSKINDEVAAILVEPVMGNVGLILPKAGFLRELRKFCDSTGSLLIFDEVITGFRLSKGGAQQFYRVTPDITIFGKILGGGFPIGAFGGRKDIMELVAPCGGMYNAGTFNGNPVSMVAGLNVIRRLNEEIYYDLASKTERLCSGFEEILEDAKIPAQVKRLGSIFTVFITDQPVRDKSTAKRARHDIFFSLHRALLELGVFFPPSQFECCFMSVAHSPEDISETLEKFSLAVEVVKRGRWG